MLDNHYLGKVVHINIELSKIDTLLDYVNGTVTNEYISILAPLIEQWFQNLQQDTNQLLTQCIKQEDWKKIQNQSYTKYVSDYCSLLFKTLEILKLLKLSPNNTFFIIIHKKLEVIIHEQFNTYFQFLENSMGPFQIQQQKSLQNVSPKKKLFQLKKNIVKSEDDQLNDLEINVNELLVLFLRVGNLDFVSQQIDIIITDWLKQSHILTSLKDTIDQYAENFIKIIVRKIVKKYWQPIFFEVLYTQFDPKQFDDQQDVRKFQKNYQQSCKNLLYILDDYMELLNQITPQQYKISGDLLNILFIECSQEYPLHILDTVKIPIVDQLKFLQFLNLEVQEFKLYLCSFFKLSQDREYTDCFNFTTQILNYYSQSNQELLQELENVKQLNEDNPKIQAIRKILMIRCKKNDNDVKIIKRRLSSFQLNLE